MTRKLLIPLILIILLGAGLAACSPGSKATPQQIAVYPSSDAETTTYTYSPPPGRAQNILVIYNARLDLAVWNVESATEKAQETAADYDGYLSSARSWYYEEQKYTTLVLSVPAANFDAAHRALKGLGKLEGEHITSELVDNTYGTAEWQQYSEITLQLHPRTPAASWPEPEMPDWRLARTFAKAFGVFTSLFGFLLDVAIWLTVVVGPFVLLGLGIKKLFQRVNVAPPPSAE